MVVDRAALSAHDHDVAGAAAVFEPWDDSPDDFKAWLTSRGWLPSEHRQRRALDELLGGDWVHDLQSLASSASVLHTIYRENVLGDDPVVPKWLAAFANVAVVPTLSADESSWDPHTRAASIPLHRPSARREHDILHELAHATLFPNDDHPSVQRLAALLAVDRPTYQATVARHGPGAGLIRLVHAQTHLPAFVVAASGMLWGRIEL